MDERRAIGAPVSAAEQLVEKIHVDGLDEMVIKSCGARPAPGLVIVAARDRDDQPVRKLRAPTQRDGYLVAVDAWQRQVQQNDLGLEDGGGRERRLAIVSDLGITSPQPEQGGERLRGRSVVVDDQYPESLRGRSLRRTRRPLALAASRGGSTPDVVTNIGVSHAPRAWVRASYG
jgi:hypothetical protein